MESKKRLLNSSQEEPSEGWTVVSKRRKPQTAPIPAARVSPPQALSHPTKAISHPTITPRQHGLPKFKLTEKLANLTAYQTVLHLEAENPALKISAKPNLQGIIIIQPKDRASTLILREYPQLLQELNPADKTSKAILARYPLSLPLDPILRLENIITAERCLSAAKQPTPSILVTFNGTVPSKVDLGTWGTFQIKTYYPEPRRCTNCQRFGHHVKQCSNHTVCGICSGRHQTQQCLDLLKAGRQIQARCPNCRGTHHAWNKECPRRKALIHQLPGAKQPQTTPTSTPAQAATTSPPLPQRVHRERAWRQKTPAQATTAPSQGFWAPPPPAPVPAPPKPQPKPSINQTPPREETITLKKQELASLLSGFALMVADLLGANLDKEKVSQAAEVAICNIQNTHTSTPQTHNTLTPTHTTPTPTHTTPTAPTPTHSTPTPTYSTPTPKSQTTKTPTKQQNNTTPTKTTQKTTPRTRNLPVDLQHLVQEEEVMSAPEMDQDNFPSLPLFNPRDPRLTKAMGDLHTPEEME